MPRLSPLQEILFEKWAQQNAPRDLNNPLAQYDLRGFWLENPNFKRAPGEHLTDKFKLPGHPTFSRESMYSRGPNHGGIWEGETYIPNLAISHDAPNADIDPTQLRNALIDLFRK